MQFETNIQPMYPIEDWTITETAFHPAHNYRNETIFALGNGYIGTRGTFEEDYGFSIEQGLEGNFLNGFFERQPIRYGELGVGFPQLSQTMLNVANAKRISLELEGERFLLTQGTVKHYRRTLDLSAGTLTREVEWVSPDGRHIRLAFLRLVSFERTGLILQRCAVTPLGWHGAVRISMGIDGDVENHTRHTNPLIDYGPYGRVLNTVESTADERGCYLCQQTQISELAYACMLKTAVLGGSHVQMEYAPAQLAANAVLDAQVADGETLVLEQYIAYADSRTTAPHALRDAAEQICADAQRLGVNGLCAEQKAFLDAFWQCADVRVDGNEVMQQGLRFNLFHLLQGAARDGHNGLCAKCLTGEGYEGHYFWDTEMYMLPFFTATFPQVSEKLLNFRYHTLDKARERARQMSGKGALYPWRTINGEEASAYYPQGTAQYHINADIAYALGQYLSATGNTDYLLAKGAEIFIETARMWSDLGAFTPLRDGAFCICDVTGPDEYTSVVDNNCYTNLMARENLRMAVRAVRWMRQEHQDRYEQLAGSLSLQDEEVELWQQAADRMYLPYHEQLGIYGQDDTYLYKKPIDISSIPKEDFSLLLHSHPLVVYRYRLSKQTDLILALFLLGEQFTLAEKRRNFAFYETTTMHSSSLSLCIAGIMAAELGEYEKADEYLSCTTRLDLDDYHSNIYAGVHAANMAGSWMGIVYGYGGMRMRNDQLAFQPYLPRGWQGYHFCVRYRGRMLQVEVTRNETCYTLREGEPLAILHYQHPVVVHHSAVVENEVKL